MGGEAPRTVRCLVSGRVQGVYYRASTAQAAARLGLSGFAKNLADGRVEVVACGSGEALAALCSWLWQGPPAARVDDVSVEEYTATIYKYGEFKVL